jgi:anti-sigma B factor antagonist
MTYIGIKSRLVGEVTILDADSQGRICLKFGASTVPLPRAIYSLLEEGQNQILLNLASVNYMDANDLSELVSTWVTVNEHGGQIKLVNLTPRLAELMTSKKVLSLFYIYESESQAVDSFKIHTTARAQPTSFSSAAT